MINTIIFDIGNVLIDFDWHGLINRLLPNADEELISTLDSAVWGEGRWDRLDAGDDPQEVFDSIVAQVTEHEKILRLIFENVGETLKKRPATPGWLKRLKARGYRLLYLSNYSNYAMEKNPEVLDCLKFLDGGVFSCDVKMIKPQRGIYECLAKKYNLIPEECVFIDDLEKNVKGAKDFGYNAIQFVTLEQVQRDLDAMLKEVK